MKWGFLFYSVCVVYKRVKLEAETTRLVSEKGIKEPHRTTTRTMRKEVTGRQVGQSW